MKSKKRKTIRSGEHLSGKRRHILVLSAALLAFILSACGKQMPGKAPEVSWRAESTFMQMAIDEARQGIYNADGGPFGCVIVKDGKVVGSGHNRVLADCDSTSHGEITAIRMAEKSLKTYDLTGCELYTTGEPCTMCLAACLWANIEKVYYGCTIEDNAKIGFRDENFDDIFGGRESLPDYLEELDRDACLMLFEEYNAMEKTLY